MLPFSGSIWSSNLPSDNSAKSDDKADIVPYYSGMSLPLCLPILASLLFLDLSWKFRRRSLGVEISLSSTPTPLHESSPFNHWTLQLAWVIMTFFFFPFQGSPCTRLHGNTLQFHWKGSHHQPADYGKTEYSRLIVNWGITHTPKCSVVAWQIVKGKQYL